jgi:hypothetical protein
MESQRAAFEYAQLQLLQRARSAEQTMLLLLRNPLESWGEDAIWQLAMCEFAVEHIDTQLSAMQLQVAFRAACETARHPDEVPRLRGAMEIDSLAMAFAKSAPLREELHRQLEAFKRFCRSCGLGLGGFGRFRRINEVRGESLLALMRRTHLDALKWRPPGAPPAEQLAVTSKAKGRYIAEWRGETGDVRCMCDVLSVCPSPRMQDYAASMARTSLQSCVSRRTFARLCKRKGHAISRGADGPLSAPCSAMMCRPVT